jgi:beta-lactam-binding protein with PASTA domain
MVRLAHDGPQSRANAVLSVGLRTTRLLDSIASMDEEDTDSFRPPASSPVPAAVIAALVTTLAVYFALRALDERGIFSFAAKRNSVTEAVEVPSLLGMRPEAAREVLQGRELLLSFSAERDSARYPAGTIAEQTPLLGSQLTRGSAIQAVLSRGPRRIEIPKVVGMTAEDAVRQLTEAGLVVGPQRAIVSDAVGAGTIVETDPPVGTQLGDRGSVTLVVSSGAADKPIPKVLGMRVRAARELLEQHGFRAGKIRFDRNDSRPGGIVLEQRPAPPATVSPGALVDLVVNED